MEPEFKVTMTDFAAYDDDDVSVLVASSISDWVAVKNAAHEYVRRTGHTVTLVRQETIEPA